MTLYYCKSDTRIGNMIYFNSCMNLDFSRLSTFTLLYEQLSDGSVHVVYNIHGMCT